MGLTVVLSSALPKHKQVPKTQMQEEVVSFVNIFHFSHNLSLPDFKKVLISIHCVRSEIINITVHIISKIGFRIVTYDECQVAESGLAMDTRGIDT